MHNTHASMPGAIIGYRRNGTSIRLIACGSGEGDGAGAGGSQSGAGTDSGRTACMPITCHKLGRLELRATWPLGHAATVT